MALTTGADVDVRNDPRTGDHQPVETFELGRLTGYLVRRAQQAHFAAWQREVSAEVSSVQFGVLNELARHPGASQKQLCDALDLDRSTIADLVKRLQRNGLIRRTRDPDDRRRNVLELTEEGAAAYELLLPGVRRVDELLTAGMQADEAAELRRLLDLLLTGWRARTDARRT